MTTESQRETAIVYTFPARGRFADNRNAAGRPADQRSVETVMGSGWYHEEAIREESARKEH